MPIRPTHNHFYKEQSRIKFQLFDSLQYYSDVKDPDFRFCLPAFHLRRLFMVTAAEVDLPPFPTDQLIRIRQFLAGSYEDPQRVIELSSAQIREILAGIQPYRVYNVDNYPIVMRHLTHPDEDGRLIVDGMVHPKEREILEDVLSLIPDADPKT